MLENLSASSRGGQAWAKREGHLQREQESHRPPALRHDRDDRSCAVDLILHSSLTFMNPWSLAHTGTVDLSV